MNDRQTEISLNIKKLKEKVERAAFSCNRKESDIKILAVSKTKPYTDVICAARSDMFDFGENRPQELSKKYTEVCDYLNSNNSLSDTSFLAENKIHWHQIGQLQKNKVKYIIDKADLIHSIDSVSLAEEINKRAAAINKIQDILIQVNISGEDTKSGISPEDAPKFCRELSDFSNIHIKGLMTISVKGYTYDENKNLFLSLKQLSQDIADLNIPNVDMSELSMGMSHDFEAAIEAGATIIRVGSLIFGERDYMV